MTEKELEDLKNYLDKQIEHIEKVSFDVFNEMKTRYMTYLERVTKEIKKEISVLQQHQIKV